MWLFKWPSLIASTLSFVILAKHGFDVGSFIAPLHLVLKSYEAFMNNISSWAEPFLTDTITYMLGWDLQLNLHWKHVFLVMWLYFAADACANWNFGNIIRALSSSVGKPRMWLAVSATVWGGLVALASGTGVGVVALDDPTSNVFMVAVVVAGVVLYEFGFNALASSFLRGENTSWWNGFRSHLRFPLQLAAVSIIILLLSTQLDKVPFVKTLKSPGLGLLAVSLVVLALYRVQVGARWVSQHRELEDKWWDVFRLSVSGPLGIHILLVIGGAAAVILINAGLAPIVGL